MKTIAITGAAGYLGQRLIDQLTEDAQVERILALDIRPVLHHSTKVQFVEHDVTQPMSDLFQRQGVTAAVHLAFILNPTHDREQERRVNVGGAENFLAACAATGVDTVLVASSGTAYGAWPDNPPQLRETDPLRGKPGFAYVEDKVAVEGLIDAYAAAHPACRVITVRPSVVLGPHVDNFISRAYNRPVSIQVGRANPPVPLVHERDFARATWHLLHQGPAGAYNLDAPDPPTLRQGAAILGARLVPVAPPLLYPLAQLAWRLGLNAIVEAPAVMLDYVRYRWTLDGSKVTRLTDFSYEFDARAALADYVAHRA